MLELGFHGRGWAPDPRPLDVAGAMFFQDGAMCWPPALIRRCHTGYQPVRAPGFLAARPQKKLIFPLHVSLLLKLGSKYAPCSQIKKRCLESIFLNLHIFQ